MNGAATLIALAPNPPIEPHIKAQAPTEIERRIGEAAASAAIAMSCLRRGGEHVESGFAICPRHVPFSCNAMQEMVAAHQGIRDEGGIDAG